MLWNRGVGIQGKERELLLEMVQDKMLGLSSLQGSLLDGLSIDPDNCIPKSARCDADTGNSSIPQFQAILNRALNATITKIENKIHVKLYPRRYTNYAKTAREVYEDRTKYSKEELYSFLVPLTLEYPRWDDLNEEQKGYYANTSSIYKNGTLPWDLLTTDQKNFFTRGVLFVENKIEDEKKFDGKGRSYISLGERPIIKIYRMYLNIRHPYGSDVKHYFRSFSDEEYKLYPNTGQVELFHSYLGAYALGIGGGFRRGNSAYGGYTLPEKYPQILHVDFEFGIKEIPEDIQEAIAYLTAAEGFTLLGNMYTKGLSGFSVQGFSVNFKDGMYSEVIKRYEKKAEEILARRSTIAVQAWG